MKRLFQAWAALSLMTILAGCCCPGGGGGYGSCGGCCSPCCLLCCPIELIHNILCVPGCSPSSCYNPAPCCGSGCCEMPCGGSPCCEGGFCQAPYGPPMGDGGCCNHGGPGPYYGQPGTPMDGQWMQSPPQGAMPMPDGAPPTAAQPDSAPPAAPPAQDTNTTYAPNFGNYLRSPAPPMFGPMQTMAPMAAAPMAAPAMIPVQAMQLQPAQQPAALPAPIQQQQWVPAQPQ